MVIELTTTIVMLTIIIDNDKDNFVTANNTSSYIELCDAEVNYEPERKEYSITDIQFQRYDQKLLGNRKNR